MARLPPLFYKDFASGMISNLSDNIAPKNSVRLMMNLDADEITGAATTRLGTSIVGSQLVSGKSVLGLHQHNPAGGTAKLFAAISNSGATNNIIKDVLAGTDSLTGDTVGLKTRFLTYLGETLRLNGTDAPKAWNGSSWVTTGGAFDLADMPTTHKYAINFLDRVYMAGASATPNRVVYSGLSNGSAVAWASDYIDIDANDNGGAITGFGKVPGYLLIFKERTLHRFNYYSAFPETLIQIGAPSQEAIVMGHGLCAFFSASAEDGKGFYITNGNRPLSISHDRVRSIKKWVDAISSSSYANVAGYVTDRGFAWSVGDLTVDGETWSNVVLKWNRVLDQWTVRSYPSEFKCFTGYYASNKQVTVGGDDNGNVIQIDAPSVYTDYPTTKIFWHLEPQEDKFEYNQLKTISERIVLDATNLNTATIQVKTNDLRQQNLAGTPEFPMKAMTATKFKFRVSGEVEGTQGILREIEIPNIDVLQNYK